MTVTLQTCNTAGGADTYHHVYLHQRGRREGQRRENHPSRHFPQRPEGHADVSLALSQGGRDFMTLSRLHEAIKGILTSPFSKRADKALIVL